MWRRPSGAPARGPAARTTRTALSKRAAAGARSGTGEGGRGDLRVAQSHLGRIVVVVGSRGAGVRAAHEVPERRAGARRGRVVHLPRRDVVRETGVRGGREISPRALEGVEVPAYEIV